MQACCVSLASSSSEVSSVLAYLQAAQRQITTACQQLEQLAALLSRGPEWQQQQRQRHRLEGVQGSSSAAASRGSAARGAATARDISVKIAGARADGQMAELQLEVAALQLQLQRREAEVQQLLTREKQLLSGEVVLAGLLLCTASAATRDTFN
jgi:hypothetical protein